MVEYLVDVAVLVTALVAPVFVVVSVAVVVFVPVVDDDDDCDGDGVVLVETVDR